VDVTPELISESESALSRFDSLARRVGSAPSAAAGLSGAVGVDGAAIAAFNEAMSNDLDTPGGVAQLFDLIRAANVSLDGGDTEAGSRMAATAFEIAGAMGLFAKVSDDEVDAATAEVVERMIAARAAKDWATADALRAELQAAGWVVEQSKEGTSVHR
jgi:cysteinyl-tRNA synthetase